MYGYIDLLISIAAKMAEEPFKLLVVDSMTANLRVDFSGRGELAERQQRLAQMMSRLRKVLMDPCHTLRSAKTSLSCFPKIHLISDHIVGQRI